MIFGRGGSPEGGGTIPVSGLEKAGSGVRVRGDSSLVLLSLMILLMIAGFSILWRS